MGRGYGLGTPATRGAVPGRGNDRAPGGVAAPVGADPRRSTGGPVMHHRLSAMLDGTVRLGEEELEVVDAWLEPADARLRYVALDVGSWLRERSALLAAGALVPREGRWTTAVTREEVEAAQVEPEGGFHLDMTSLPAILTGPFGNTISPMMIAAGLRAEAAEEAPPARPEDRSAAPDDDAPALDAEALTRQLVRWEDWREAPVFARDGEVGPLIDLILDDVDWRPARAVVAAARGPVALPWSLLRRRVPGSGHLVMAIDADHVASAPDGLTGGAETDEALHAHYTA